MFTFVALFSASWVSSVLLTDQRVYYTFVSMTPMIAIVAVSSIYRGYFQGRQNMIPSAFSSVLESVIRIFFMLWFSWMLLPKGIAFAAAGAMLGVTVGEIAGMLALLGQYYFNDKKDRSELPPNVEPMVQDTQGSAGREPAQTTTPVFKRLIGISIPVTAGRLIGSFSYLLESIITVRSLALAGIAAAAATAQYGSLQGMVIPLLLLPGVLRLLAGRLPCPFLIRGRSPQRFAHDSQKNAPGPAARHGDRCPVCCCYVYSCRTALYTNVRQCGGYGPYA